MTDPRAEPRRQARRLREAPRPRRRRLPRRDRRHMAPAPRLAHEPDRTAHLRRHRRARLQARPQGPRGQERTCPRAPWSRSPAARPSAMPTRSGARSTWRARSTATWCCCMAAVPASRRSPRAGPRARSVNQVICRPRLEGSRQGRALPPQRRPAQPAAQGRHRLPRQRDHRQPRRQSSAARHTGDADEGRVSGARLDQAAGASRHRPLSSCFTTGVIERRPVRPPVGSRTANPSAGSNAGVAALRAGAVRRSLQRPCSPPPSAAVHQARRYAPSPMLDEPPPAVSTDIDAVGA